LGAVAMLGSMAAPRTVPVGDKVALGEMASRVLSASLTPRKVFGGGEARRKLVRMASFRTRAVWGLLLVDPEQPGRNVGQRLGALHRCSLLPKTKKIAT